jgi:hypothetical protein
MTRAPRKYQLAGLAALEATVEIAMRALVETYPELHREPRPDDSTEAVTAAKLVDQCGRLLAALDAHRQHLARVPANSWPF